MNPQDTAPVSDVPPAIQSGIEAPISLFKFSWNFFVTHWKILILIVIVPTALNFIGTSFGQSETDISYMAIGGILALVGFVFSIAMVPALINTVHRLVSNSSEVISVKKQYAFGFKYFWSVALVGIIVGFATLGSSFLLIIPGIIFVVYTAFYLFALIIDDKRGFSALTESYRLVKNRWMAVAGRLLFLGLIFIIIQVILMLVGFLFGAASGLSLSSLVSSDPTQTMQVTLISGFLNLIGTCIMTPLSMIYMYRLYTSLKTTVGQDATVGSFKKWVVTFIVVGILGLIALVTIPLFVLNNTQSKVLDSSPNTEALMAQIQAEIEEQMGTTSINIQ